MSEKQVLPVHRRSWHAFLSHSSKDKDSFVEPLYEWLTEVAKIPTWYDTTAISGGQRFQQVFSEAVYQCRSLIIILSKTSVESSWVVNEYELAFTHQNEYKDFKIIPVLLDADCEIPPMLKTRDIIYATDRKLNVEFFDNLLRALYPGDINVHQNQNQDIFVSRTWRDNEAAFADQICHAFIKGRFRLVGDAKDRQNYDGSKTRVYDIIRSCGGLLAVLPYRSNEKVDEKTSKYMLDEIRFAQDENIPYAIYYEKGVNVPSELAADAIYILSNEDVTADKINKGVEELREKWSDPIKPQYVFFATNFKHRLLDETKSDEEANKLTKEIETLNRKISKTIERITGMKCWMGEEIFAPNHISVQQAIIDIIKNSYLFIGDVSSDNINTLIETGVARGASINHYMVASGRRHRPPFMLRDEQIFYYEDEAEMLGRVYMLTYTFRRRILNYEIIHKPNSR